MKYDERCYDLAALFLADTPWRGDEKEIDALAQVFQADAEAHCQMLEERLEFTRERRRSRDRLRKQRREAAAD